MIKKQELTVPALRFPEFSGEWTPTSLGKQSTCLDNKRIPLKEGDRANRRGCYPYYGASGIIDSIDDYLFDETLVLLAEDGANIIMRNSPIAFLARGKYWVNNHAHVYRAKGSSEFLATYLENLRYEKYNTGTAQPKLNGEVCKKLRLIFPPLPEQQKIASFLSAVDRKIEQLTKKKDLLQHYKKGMMQKLFSQELRFKDVDGNEFPDWERKKISDIGYFYYGKSAPKFSINKDASTLCVRYGELYSTYREVIADVQSRTNIEPSALRYSVGGEILIPRVGEDPLDFCRCSYLPIAGVAIGEMISVFNTEENSLFYTYYFNTLKKEFARMVEGGSVANLYFRYLEPIEILRPVLSEQQTIADFLTSIDKKIDLVSTELTHAQAFKKGLLQQMFV